MTLLPGDTNGYPPATLRLLALSLLHFLWQGAVVRRACVRGDGIVPKRGGALRRCGAYERFVF